MKFTPITKQYMKSKPIYNYNEITKQQLHEITCFFLFVFKPIYNYKETKQDEITFFFFAYAEIYINHRQLHTLKFER